MKGLLSAMQINKEIASNCRALLKLPPLLPVGVGLLGKGSGVKLLGVGCCYNICTSQRLGEPETAVIRPDYL